MHQLLTKTLLFFLTLVTLVDATHWKQIGDTISGEFAGDYRGQVSINGYETRVAIGYQVTMGTLDV